MKSKPLDLKEIEKKILKELPFVVGDTYVGITEEERIEQVIKKTIELTKEEITQRLKSALQGLDDDIDFLYRKFEKYDVWSKSNDEVCDMCEKYFKKQVKKWFPDVMEND